jgi:hypothetical protein
MAASGEPVGASDLLRAGSGRNVTVAWVWAPWSPRDQLISGRSRTGARAPRSRVKMNNPLPAMIAAPLQVQASGS